MKKYIFALLISIGTGIFLLQMPATAHELKTSGSISALLHINPDDDPVANQPSELLFLITDKDKKFNPENCDCQSTVIENDQTLFSSSLFKGRSSYQGIFAPAIPYTFPHIGIYTIQLSGKPKNSADFQPFAISYTLRVEKDKPTHLKSPIANLVYIIIAGALAAAAIYIIRLFITNKTTIDLLKK